MLLTVKNSVFSSQMIDLMQEYCSWRLYVDANKVYSL